MLQAPSSSKTDTLADWAEAACLFGKHTSVSESELEKVLDEAGTPNLDDAVSDIWREIYLRHREVGKTHPVKTQHGRLERIQLWTQNLAYAFQLLLALEGQYESTKISPQNRIPTAKLFERLSTSVLKEYLSGEAINFGVSREEPIPKGFSDGIEYVCEKLKEIRGTLESYTSWTKDDGVDVIAWRPFGDERSGKVIILVQCASGGDWTNKVNEIGIDLWQDHIRCAVEPIKALAFPFVCLDKTQWRRLSRKGPGILLDRLRITSMFMSVSNPSSDLQTQLKVWCEKQLPLLPWMK